MLNPNSKLWRAIEASGLKREYIAEKCAITPKALSQIVRGRQSANEEQKTLLAKELRCPVAELFDVKASGQ